MKPNPVKAVAYTVAAVLLTLAVPAHALRCNHKLITEGDPSVKLLRYCGEPLSVRSRYAQRLLMGSAGRRILYPGFIGNVLIEEWTYNFGPNKLMRVVRIEDGIVVEIRNLGYGFVPRH